MKVRNLFSWWRLDRIECGTPVLYSSFNKDSPYYLFIGKALVQTTSFCVPTTHTGMSALLSQNYFPIITSYCSIFDHGTNETTTECVVITMTATMLLRSLSAWHRQRSVVTAANVPVCDLCDVSTSSPLLAILPSISSMMERMKQYKNAS